MYNGLPEILCNNRGLRNQLEIMGGKPSKCTVEGADPVNFKIASDDKYQRHVNQSLHQELNQARKNPQGADKLTPPLGPPYTASTPNSSGFVSSTGAHKIEMSFRFSSTSSSSSSKYKHCKRLFLHNWRCCTSSPELIRMQLLHPIG